MNIERKHAYSNISEYVIAVLILCTIPPYFLWNYYSIANPIITISIFIISIICNYHRINKVSPFNFHLYIAVAILFAYIAVRNGDSIQAFLSLQLKACLLLFPSVFLSGIFNKFCKLYSALLIPSIIAYILVVILNIDIPYHIIDPLNELKNYNYKVYPFLVQNNVSHLGTFRFEGYFDEPGVIGTISGSIILIKGINWRKWDTWIILISGLMSLSLTFYIMLILCLIVNAEFKILVPAILIIGFLILLFRDNEIFNSLIVERLVIEDGSWAGNNRTVAGFDTYFKKFLHSDYFYFGYGNYYAQNIVNVGGSSYKDLIINYGIIGFIFILFIPILSAISRMGISRKSFTYILTFCCIIYQRPYLTSPAYFVLLYLSIFYLKEFYVYRRQVIYR